MLCKVCGEKEAVARSMCHRCITKVWRKENPEKVKESIRKYRESHKKELIQKNKKWRKDNPKKEKEIRKRYYEKHKEELKEKNREWRNKNREKFKECLELSHKKEVCKILKDHAQELKDDPERLSTEFIRKMSNIKFECEK